MRLIDADDIVYDSIDSEDTNRHAYYYGTGIMAARKEDIEAMPTIDAIPVVRCKDCKHYKAKIDCVGGKYSGCDVWTDNGNECYVESNWYCSFGERGEARNDNRFNNT